MRSVAEVLNPFGQWLGERLGLFGVAVFRTAAPASRQRCRGILYASVSVIPLVLVGCLGGATTAARGLHMPGAQKKEAGAEKGKPTAATKLEFGFRCDPMQWVERDRTLRGAMVRTLVFGKPRRGDKKLIGAEADRILSGQLPDGRLSDDPKHSYQFTAEALIRLAEMGCPASRPGVQKALAAILGKPKPNPADPHGIYDVRAFCLLGLSAEPPYRDIVRKGIQGVMAREKEWSDITEGCPWTPVEHLITLWVGREVVETKPCVARALKWLGEGIESRERISVHEPYLAVRDIADEERFAPQPHSPEELALEFERPRYPDRILDGDLVELGRMFAGGAPARRHVRVLRVGRKHQRVNERLAIEGNNGTQRELSSRNRVQPQSIPAPVVVRPLLPRGYDQNAPIRGQSQAGRPRASGQTVPCVAVPSVEAQNLAVVINRGKQVSAIVGHNHIAQTWAPWDLVEQRVITRRVDTNWVHGPHGASLPMRGIQYRLVWRQCHSGNLVNARAHFDARNETL